jgi:hypothetical protein
MPPKRQQASEEYTAFDAGMRRILMVSKTELDARVKAHKERAALNPNKRGPKPKLKSSSSDDHADAETS